MHSLSFVAPTVKQNQLIINVQYYYNIKWILDNGHVKSKHLSYRLSLRVCRYVWAYGKCFPFYAFPA